MKLKRMEKALAAEKEEKVRAVQAEKEEKHSILKTVENSLRFLGKRTQPNS